MSWVVCDLGSSLYGCPRLHGSLFPVPALAAPTSGRPLSIMAPNLHWGILSTGHIAGVFARAIAHSRTGSVVAVGSRNSVSADRFADAHGISRRHGNYADLLADTDVDAVYIATPHPMHAEWVVRSAESRKHILCEKPLGVNHAEATTMIQAAQKNDVFLMEAFMYRCHPQTRRLVGLIQDGVIGAVRVIRATFSYHKPFHPASRLYRHELGGGAILDVGCYCVSYARLIAGVGLGRELAEPIEVRGHAKIGDASRVDEWSTAILKFEGGILAQLACGVGVRQKNTIEVYGTDGSLEVPVPWNPNREGGVSEVRVCQHDKVEEVIEIATDQWTYAIEADVVAERIEERQAKWPAVTWADTLGNMRALDRWRATAGMMYDIES